MKAELRFILNSSCPVKVYLSCRVKEDGWSFIASTNPTCKFCCIIATCTAIAVKSAVFLAASCNLHNFAGLDLTSRTHLNGKMGIAIQIVDVP